MSAKKVNRHDLKKPDEFVEFGKRAVEWIQNNAKVAAAAVAGVLLVSVAIIALFQISSGKKEEAAFKYGQASDEFRKASALHGAEREAKLKEVAAKLQAVYDAYPDTRAADYALLQIGQAHYEIRNYEQAANAFVMASTRFEKEPNFKAMALVGAGKSYEALRDFNKALDYYQRTNAVEGNPYQEVLKSDIGRIRIYKDQFDAANAVMNPAATLPTGK